VAQKVAPLYKRTKVAFTATPGPVQTRTSKAISPLFLFACKKNNID